MKIKDLEKNFIRRDYTDYGLSESESDTDEK